MNRKFPKELLEKSSAEKADYFAAHRIAHPKLIKTYNALLEAVEDAKKGSIITVLGPTGVGKTTLLERLRQKTVDDFHKNSLDQEPETVGRIPIAMIEAVSANNGFDWKDYYRRLLAELFDPLPTRKIDYRKWEALPNEVSEIMQSDKTSATVYRRAVEKALQHRQPVAVLIDEAQHIGATASGRKTLDQLNHIKSIANLSKTVHVLCGSYELLSFLNLSGQLSRRSSEIHFERYSSERSEDINVFRNVVWELQNHLPVNQEPNLLDNWEYLYERSVGCIGTLHDWLLRALKKSLRENAETVTLEILEQTALSLTKCQTIYEEIIIGEGVLGEKENSRINFRQKLGLGIFDSAEIEIAQPKKNKTNVGIRNATRDPVGQRTAS